MGCGDLEKHAMHACGSTPAPAMKRALDAWVCASGYGALTTQHTTSIATKGAPYTRLITTSALALQSQHRSFRDVVGGYIRIVHSVTHVEGGCGCRNIRKQDAPQASQEELDQKQFVSK